ncbi:MAG: AraC family transcriptional regulator [Tannerella sp.]|jgi:AraC-like DNA-binding protein|nr:AraC family transcriptional regulator [Tannerella sp.]
MVVIQSKNIKYFNISALDESWGIVVTTVGRQLIPPHSSYPLSQHPESHIFNPDNGRVLKEYQLIYIPEGSGYFESKSCKKRKITAGTMILLFPNEWHTYEPDKDRGWVEYWVGFHGLHIDNRVKNGFFSPATPVFHLGFSSAILGLYEDILNHAAEERAGYQQLISSIVLYILGLVHFMYRNETFSDSYAVIKINEARAIMKQTIEEDISPGSIAERIGVSYSWFRKMFKKYVDVSPAQYQANLKFLRSKELLNTTNLSITEIAYKLNFENVGKFSTFFNKKEGLSPLQYRKEVRNIGKSS